MKIALVVWALLFVVVEMVANRLAAAGWRPLQVMDLLGGAVDALPLFAVVLGVALCAGALVRSWRRSVREWERDQRERLAAARAEEQQERLTVRAWRGEPLPLPAGAVREASFR